MASKAHPGFKAVQSKIEGEGYSAASAGAILADKSRGASAAAKKKNPRLKRVKGKQKSKKSKGPFSFIDRDSNGM